MILVVGATGQLGTAIVRKLADRGLPVRALVRRTSNHKPLTRDGVDIVFGDLRDRSSLEAACSGVHTVIATANAAIPTQKGDSFTSVDGRGYENLIATAKLAGVRQFIYTSALSNPGFDNLPIGRQKRITEDRLRSSGINYTIFRPDAFMDVYFAMMGTDIPVQGVDGATVERPFWFTSRFFKSVKDSIGKHGTVGILGDGNTRHSYVCVDDVAEFHVNAVGREDAFNKTFDIGGPESLTQNEVLEIFETILDRRLKPKRTPAGVFKAVYFLLRFISPAAANIMGLNYCSTLYASDVEMDKTAELFGVQMTSAENFLRERAGKTIAKA